MQFYIIYYCKRQFPFKTVFKNTFPYENSFQVTNTKTKNQQKLQQSSVLRKRHAYNICYALSIWKE